MRPDIQLWLYTGVISAGLTITGCRSTPPEAIPTFPLDPDTPTEPSIPTTIPTLIPTPEPQPTLLPEGTPLPDSQPIILSLFPKEEKPVNKVVNALNTVISGVVREDFDPDDPTLKNAPDNIKKAATVINQYPEVRETAVAILNPTIEPTMRALAPTWQARKELTQTKIANSASVPSVTPVPTYQPVVATVLSVYNTRVSEIVSDPETPIRYKDQYIIDQNKTAAATAEAIIMPTIAPTLTAIRQKLTDSTNATLTAEAKMPPTSTPTPTSTPAPPQPTATSTQISKSDYAKRVEQIKKEFAEYQKENNTKNNTIRSIGEGIPTPNILPTPNVPAAATRIAQSIPSEVKPLPSVDMKIQRPTPDASLINSLDFQARSYALLQWRFDRNHPELGQFNSPPPIAWVYRKSFITSQPFVNGKVVTNAGLLIGELSPMNTVFRTKGIEYRFDRAYPPSVPNAPDYIYSFTATVVEREYRNLAVNIISRDNLTQADFYNGITWRGTVRVSFVVQSRVIRSSVWLEDNPNPSLPDVKYQSFGPWSDSYEDLRISQVNGSWSARSAPAYAVPVIRG